MQQRPLQGLNQTVARSPERPESLKAKKKTFYNLSFFVCTFHDESQQHLSTIMIKRIQSAELVPQYKPCLQGQFGPKVNLCIFPIFFVVIPIHLDCVELVCELPGSGEISYRDACVLFNIM